MACTWAHQHSYTRYMYVNTYLDRVGSEFYSQGIQLGDIETGIR